MAVLLGLKEMIRTNINQENKLKEYYIPKEYLNNNKFSYKLYLIMCSNMYWNIYSENEITRYEYILNYISIKDIVNISNISRQKILKQFEGNPYRLKIDESKNRHLMINSPIKNYIKMSLETLTQLINEEEMAIRTYIYLQGFSYDIIYGVTNEKVLENISYSSTSSNNKSKLTKCINRLIKLGFIRRDIESNGLKKYSIYHKIN